jgi:putative transposase
MDVQLKKAIAQAAKKIKTTEEIQDHLKEITGPLIEKILEEELTHKLRYEKYDSKGKNSFTSKNRLRQNKVLSSRGWLALQIPRDRNGKFVPAIIKSYQKELSNFD